MASLVFLSAQATKDPPSVKIHTHTLRVLHKWIGLVIGLQFVLWTLSGAMMALLSMDEVAGGKQREPMEVRRPVGDGWPSVQRQLGSTPVSGLSLRSLLDRQIYEVKTPRGVRLFETETGKAIPVDAQLARQVATTAYPGNVPVRQVQALDELSLAVREHELPIWQVDFSDAQNSSYYVSGATGALLERRNDTWRLWDFFWMLHNMDYAKRSSFNHPLIIMVGFAAAWLAISGLYLLFRTGWRSDFKRWTK